MNHRELDVEQSLALVKGPWEGKENFNYIRLYDWLAELVGTLALNFPDADTANRVRRGVLFTLQRNGSWFKVTASVRGGRLLFVKE